VLALTVPAQYETTHAVPAKLKGDMDQDGDVDFDDIPGFIDILAPNPTFATAVSAVPEPPTAPLLALGLGIWALGLTGRRPKTHPNGVFLAVFCFLPCNRFART